MSAVDKNINEIFEGTQYVQQGEGLVFSINPANWGITSQAAVNSVKAYKRDGSKTDVTSTVIPSGSATVASTSPFIITLPEMVFPSSLGLIGLEIEVSIEVEGYSPGIIDIPIQIID